MASTAVGLYIGTDNADIVQLGGTFQHPRLISFGRVQLPQQGSWRAQVRAEEAGPGLPAESGSAPVGGPATQDLVQSIKTLLQRIGLNSTRVYAAVASEAVVIRYFQMPTIPPHEQKSAISFEAKKYLPFKLEELVTDYQVVTNRADPTVMRVMFFGIKKNSLGTYLSLIESANLSPLCLEPAPMSLLRLMRQIGQLPTGEVAAILFIERDTATISIARDNLLYLSRNVTILPSAEADRDPLAELMEALINETRVSIDYYRRRFLGEPAVTKIVLFGKEIDEKKVEELTSALSLPVEIGDPFKKIVGSREVPAGLSVATGLALRGLQKTSGEINLLPAEQRQQSQGILKALCVEAACAGMILGSCFALTSYDLDSWEKKISSSRASEMLPQGLKPGAESAELQHLREEVQKEYTFSREALKGRTRYASLVYEISRDLPPEMWLNQVAVDDLLKGNEPNRVLKLAGSSYFGNRSKELEVVNKFVTTLKANPSFQKIFEYFQLDSVQRGRFKDEEVTEFRLTCASKAANVKETKKNLFQAGSPP